MYKVKVDQETCVGCGMCQSTCPKVFELNREIKSRIVEKYRGVSEDEGKVPKKIDCVKEVEKNCPVDAIEVS